MVVMCGGAPTAAPATVCAADRPRFTYKYTVYKPISKYRYSRSMFWDQPDVSIVSSWQGMTRTRLAVKLLKHVLFHVAYVPNGAIC